MGIRKKIVKGSIVLCACLVAAHYAIRGLVRLPSEAICGRTNILDLYPQDHSFTTASLFLLTFISTSSFHFLATCLYQIHTVFHCKLIPLRYSFSDMLTHIHRDLRNQTSQSLLNLALEALPPCGHQNIYLAFLGISCG